MEGTTFPIHCHGKNPKPQSTSKFTYLQSCMIAERHPLKVFFIAERLHLLWTVVCAVIYLFELLLLRTEAQILERTPLTNEKSRARYLENGIFQEEDWVVPPRIDESLLIYMFLIDPNNFLNFRRWPAWFRVNSLWAMLALMLFISTAEKTYGPEKLQTVQSDCEPPRGEPEKKERADTANCFSRKELLLYYPKRERKLVWNLNIIERLNI